MVYRLRDFTRLNPTIFMGSKTSKYPCSATDTEKAKLASFQLKYVAQTSCKMWQDSRAFGGVSVTWELFKTAFLERFFPNEMREAKVEEFINL